jgi:hypothetical protein
MNPDLLAFFRRWYAPGRIGLVGATDAIGNLIRHGQAPLTPDRRPSRWSHSFILGEVRDDGRPGGSIFIFESDLHVSVHEWQVQNGAMESRLAKWCRDDVEHACVLGLDLSDEESQALIRKGLEFAYDYERTHLKYAVGQLFGTFWASLRRRLSKKNIFHEEYAVQCASFVRLCFQEIGKDPLADLIDPSHTSPEKLHQSRAFPFREEWHRGEPS